MGKPTGFMDYEREGNVTLEPLTRICNFDEFHPAISLQERQKQGGRCMDCGVPFCQSGMKLNGMFTGCPLHNLIPEWNDMIWHGNMSHALARLMKTNNFPEFTGRVCPALCEAACTCGLHGDPVTVRENELSIIEYGYDHDLIHPTPPSVRTGKRVAVIGSGPSGLACADQLNRRGHSVTVYEKEDRIGGLLMYGIPNMKLDKRIVTSRVERMAAEGVTFITSTDAAELADQIVADYDAVALCCGAGNPRDLTAPGREANGIHFAVDYLKANTKALLNDGSCDSAAITARGRHVIVVGGGDTGNDCVGTAIRQGALSVTQLEMMPKPPTERTPDNQWPQFPRTLKTDYGQQEAITLFGGDPRIYQTTVKAFLSDEAGKLRAITTVSLTLEKDEATGRVRMAEIPGSEQEMRCDLLLIAAGFVGCNAQVAQAFNVALDSRTNVKTAEGAYATSAEKVFAAGDMHRGQSLVVWAIVEGRAAAREIDEYLMGYTNM